MLLPQRGMQAHRLAMAVTVVSDAVQSPPSRRTAAVSAYERWVNFFLPPAMLRAPETRRCGRMFIATHIFGPFAGFAIISWLYRLDPNPGSQLWIPFVGLAGSWAFLPALRLSERFTLLSLLSLQNLTFIVLFLSYQYGGTSSPFLCWMIVTPLLAVFYLGDTPRLAWMTIGSLALDLGAFVLICSSGVTPVHVPLEQLRSIGAISLFCAAFYATAIAAYYARAIASKSELEMEVQRHLATARALGEAKEAATQLLKLQPTFRASHSLEAFPVRALQIRERIIAALREAGLPE